MKRIVILHDTLNARMRQIVAHVKHEFEKSDCIVGSTDLNLENPDLRPETNLLLVTELAHDKSVSAPLAKWIRQNHAQIQPDALALLVVRPPQNDKEKRADRDREQLQQFILTSMIVPRYAATVDDSEREQMTAFVRCLCGFGDDKNFLTRQLVPGDRFINRLMPEFESVVSVSRIISGFSPDEIFHVAKRLRADTSFLKWSQKLPNYFRPAVSAAALFDETSRRMATLKEKAPDEIVMAQLLKIEGLKFRPYVIEPDQFESENEPGFIKVLVRFQVSAVSDEETRVGLDVRFHSIDAVTRAKMKPYLICLKPFMSVFQQLLLRKINTDCLRFIIEPVVSDRDYTHPTQELLRL